jgi:glycosyltransferase involved in cell wall biosynthesis
MKITFVLPGVSLNGGIRVVAVFAEHLSAEGHEVTVVAPRSGMPLRRKVKFLLMGRGWPNPHFQNSYFDGGRVKPHILESWRPVAEHDVPDADVIVATFYNTAHWVHRLSPQKGAKAILIQNYEVEEGKTNPALDATWRMPMHKIVISKWLLDLARDRFGDANASLVPYGINFEQFSAPPREKQKVPAVGLLYGKSWYKGCRTSLAAFKKAAANFSACRLVCFGAEQPGPIALRLPHGAEFHFRPPQDRLKDLYRQCDVWLCGSNREGFHMPPMEAMACRCPVVSTRVGGPVDMVEPGVNGYLADIGDADGLAHGLQKVLTLPPEGWRSMSDAAYHTARRYNWDEASTLFRKALEVAVERNRRGDFKN